LVAFSRAVLHDSTLPRYADRATFRVAKYRSCTRSDGAVVVGANRSSRCVFFGHIGPAEKSNSRHIRCGSPRKLRSTRYCSRRANSARPPARRSYHVKLDGVAPKPRCLVRRFHGRQFLLVRCDDQRHRSGG
jgi:hypothetical protein